jgi:hypothetical protein
MKDEVSGLKRVPKLLHAPPIDAKVPVAGTSRRADRNDPGRRIQEQLEIINKPEYSALERCVEIRFISLDNGASRKRRQNALYFEPVFGEIPLQMKRVDFMPIVLRFRRYTIGALGQLERDVEPTSSERTAEHPKINNIIIAAFMQNMTGLTIGKQLLSV